MNIAKNENANILFWYALFATNISYVMGKIEHQYLPSNFAPL